MAASIRVNFGEPLPLFPLNEAVLLPHAVLPLHIFQPRYRQMVDDCLKGNRQFAMARTEHANNGFTDDEALPDLKPAVCIGQIVKHQPAGYGRHNILLQGVCRARICEMIEPDDERLYCLARLSPLESVDQDPPELGEERTILRCMLRGPRLCRMTGVNQIMKWFNNKQVSTHALLELVGFALVRDNELRYRLLEEADPKLRAEMIQVALRDLDGLVKLADEQSYRDWPKGMSWN